jgi:RNA polymerase sigma factor (sigma-70 family)
MRDFDSINHEELAALPLEPEPEPGLTRQELMDSCELWAYKYANDYIATRGMFRGCTREDVYQQALMGMWEATKKYEEGKGKFSTLSAWYMRKWINKLHGTSNGLVHHAKNPKYRPSKIDRELRRMREEGLEPTFEGACIRLEIPEGQRETVKTAWELKKKRYKGIEKWNEPSKGPSLVDMIAEKDKSTEESRKLREALKKLPSAVREIVEDFANEVEQHETQRRLGMSRMTLAKYRALGLQWLRYFMGLYEDPPEKPLPPEWVPRLKRDTEIGTAVLTEGGKDCA